MAMRRKLKESVHPTVYMVDAERDLCELELARRAEEIELPTLCICRGLQVLFDTLVEMAGTGEGVR